MQLHIFGTRGSFPAYGPEYSVFGNDTICYALREGDYGIILDCGSGLSGALKFLSNCTKIDILISHLHYDHIMGLFDAKTRLEGKSVTFYGEFEAWERVVKQGGVSPLYPLESLFCGTVKPITLDTQYALSKGFSAGFTRSIHPDFCSMIELRKGEKRLCYTGDYEHDDTGKITQWAADCDLLLFDGSYNSDNYSKYKNWGHSTWESACMVAGECRAKKLVITHHAAQSTDNYLEIQEQAAGTMFPNVIFARQGSVVEF